MQMLFAATCGLIRLGYFQVQTDFQQISDAQFVINIAEADNVNHVVVFLTGTTPFPEGMAGAGKLPVHGIIVLGCIFPV